MDVYTVIFKLEQLKQIASNKDQLLLINQLIKHAKQDLPYKEKIK